jgi:hypothetical protein
MRSKITHRRRCVTVRPLTAMLSTMPILMSAMAFLIRMLINILTNINIRTNMRINISIRMLILTMDTRMHRLTECRPTLMLLT